MIDADFRRLVMWRHGRTRWNLEQRFQGHTDIPLDEMGVHQAAESAKVLAALDPDLIICSDLQRARSTAQALCDLVDLEAVVDPRLRETNGGAWEGRKHDDLIAEFANFRTWVGDSEDVRPDGNGETRSEVAARVVAAINSALDALPEASTLVVVSHGGALRAGMGALLGLPQRHWAALGGLNNCAWSVLAQRHDSAGQPQWRLREYNGWSLPEPALGDDA